VAASGSSFRIAIVATVRLLRFRPCAIWLCVSSVATLPSVTFISIVLLLLVWIVLSIAALLPRLGAITLVLRGNQQLFKLTVSHCAFREKHNLKCDGRSPMHIWIDWEACYLRSSFQKLNDREIEWTPELLRFRQARPNISILPGEERCKAVDASKV
jgi:hypothetical protein